MKLITTLNIIKSHDPCTDGWRKLLKHLGKSCADNEPLEFGVILESNGVDDALWALRGVLPEQERDRDRLARLFACDCAESVLRIYEDAHPDDDRARKAIDISRRFANGEATQSELAAA